MNKALRCTLAIKKAQLVVQAQRAALDLPAATDTDVVRVANLEPAELMKKYQWAQQAMAAMRWNTATLNIPKAKVIVPCHCDLCTGKRGFRESKS